MPPGGDQNMGDKKRGEKSDASTQASFIWGDRPVVARFPLCLALEYDS